MHERHPKDVTVVRNAIPGLNQHELMLELFRTIDDASARVADALDAASIVKAINDVEARLETIEDALRRLHNTIGNSKLA